MVVTKKNVYLVKAATTGKFKPLNKQEVNWDGALSRINFYLIARFLYLFGETYLSTAKPCFISYFFNLNTKEGWIRLKIIK